MKYRLFGKLDWKVSALGFGCMRLPTAEGSWLSASIEEPKAIELIRSGIDQGINYVDTAYPYHNGKSELVLGKALQGGYRQKVRLATKSPTWLIKSAQDFDRYLEEQLKKLQTDCIDFYLLHALSHDRWHNVVLKFGLLERAEKAIREGKIRHLGFSFHDGPRAFLEILNGYQGWTFCQIQYNYMDIENQAGVNGLRQAAAKGLAVVIMEPLLGGRLANPPAAMRQILQESPVARTPVDWALQWLWDQPEVSVVLSGMGTAEQVQANLRSADGSRVGLLNAAEQALISRVRQKYLERTKIPCTKCSYCMPCPNGVNIPVNFEIYNNAFLHEDVAGAKTWYGLFLKDGMRAESCVECHACEEHCPQHIPITEWMPKVHAFLGQQSVAI